MAYPLPIEVVFYPAESKLSADPLTFSAKLHISTIPAAFPAMGPKVSTAKTMEMVERRPKAAKAIPKAPKRVKVMKAPMAIKIMGTIVEADPKARPWETYYYDPESYSLAISLTQSFE